MKYYVDHIKLRLPFFFARCLFLFYFQSEKVRTSVNGKINKRAKKLINIALNFTDQQLNSTFGIN